MCPHPEALSRVKNFIQDCANEYHDINRIVTKDLPDKGYWVERNSSYHRPSKCLDVGEAESFK